jgi:hypothetical protein
MYVHTYILTLNSSRQRGMKGLDKGGQGPTSGCCAIEEEEEEE